MEPPVGGWLGGTEVLITAEFPAGFEPADITIRFGQEEADGVTRLDDETILVTTPAFGGGGQHSGRVASVLTVRGKRPAGFFFHYLPPRILSLEPQGQLKADFAELETTELAVTTRHFGVHRHSPSVSLVRSSDGRSWPLEVREVEVLDRTLEIERIVFGFGSLALDPLTVSGASFRVEVESPAGRDRVPITLEVVEPPVDLEIEPLPDSSRLALHWTEPGSITGTLGTGYDYLRVVRTLPTGAVEESLVNEYRPGHLVDSAVDHRGIHLYGVYSYELHGGVYQSGMALESPATVASVGLIPWRLPVDVVVDLDPGLPGGSGTSGTELVDQLSILGRNPLRVADDAPVLLAGLLTAGDVRVVWVATGSTPPHLRLPSEELSAVLLEYLNADPARVYVEGGDLARWAGTRRASTLGELLRQLGLESVSPEPFPSGLVMLEAGDDRTFHFREGLGPLSDLEGRLEPLAEGLAGDLEARFKTDESMLEPGDSPPGTLPDERYAAMVVAEDGRGILASLEFRNLVSDEEKQSYLEWVLGEFALSGEPLVQPLVESVSKSTSCLTDSVAITAEGRDLQVVDRVVLGGHTAEIISRGSGSVIFLTPARDPATRPGRVELEFFDATGELVPVLSPHEEFELEGITADELTPTVVLEDAAEELTISGSGFLRHGVSGVLFGDAGVSTQAIRIVDDTRITFAAPDPSRAGLTPGIPAWTPVRVLSESCNHAELEVLFEYTLNPDPVVISAAPSSGCMMAEHRITVSGEHLEKVEAVRRQSGESIPIASQTPAELTFLLTPRSPPRPGVELVALEYREGDGGLEQLPVPFEHEGFTVVSFSPRAVCLDGGAKFHVQGTRFLSEEQGSLSCRVGGVSVDFQTLSDTELRVELPQEFPQEGDLPVVLTTDCLEVELPDGLEVGRPGVTGLEPDCACIGEPTRLTLTGTCMETVVAAILGEVRVPRESFMERGPTRVRLEVPAVSEPGPVVVRVETEGGGTMDVGEVLFAGATGLSLPVTRGYYASPTRLEVRGRFASCDEPLKLCAGSTCLEGDELEVTSGEITATVPPRASPGNLVVTLDAGCGPAALGTLELFDVTVDSLVPAAACFGTPTRVAALGSHLDYVEEVLIDATPARILSKSSTTLVFEFTPGSTVAELPGVFVGREGETVVQTTIVENPLVISGVSPVRGSYSDPGQGLIEGDCLQGVLGLVFGTRPATISSRSDTRLEFTIPAVSARGEVPILAVVYGGGIETVGSFFYANDFNETFSGAIPEWTDDGKGGWMVTGGRYRWTAGGVPGSRALRYSLNKRSFSDFTVSVRVTKERGRTFEVGLITRASALLRDGYLFTVSSSGFVSMAVMRRGVFTPLLTAQAGRFGTADGDTNVLRVEATGRTQRFYVNNSPVGVISDSTSLRGMSGVETREQDWSGDQAPIVSFDDFTATEQVP